jgi:spore germination protein YaaH
MKKKTISIIVCAIVLLVVIIAGTVSLVKKYSPGKEREDLETYYNISSVDDVAIVLDHELASSKAKVIDGYIYLDYNFLHDDLNERFYWDSNENILLCATSQELISAESDSNSYLITKANVDFGRPVVTATADSAYVDLEFACEYSDFTYTYVEDPKRIIITSQWGSYETATVRVNSTVRVKGGIKSPILTNVSARDELEVIETGDKWTRVMTSDGVVGYIKNRALTNRQTLTRESDKEPETFTHISKDYRICMAWHQVTTPSANSNISSILSSSKGINVISPTWFYLNDNSGNIASLAGSEYVTYCHSQGVEVWALVSNLENTDVDTAEVLTHTSTRQKLVNQIVSQAIQYDLDGINLDFESMTESEVGDSYIEFVRELSIKLSNNGIVLAVDNYVPSAYTAFYNRSEQAKFADYVVMMGYDEHYSGSDVGSVASISWVSQGITDTLAEVPSDQLILGMPFYTRVWTTESSDDSDSKGDVSSKVYSMSAASDFLKAHGATKTWNEDSGQNYAEIKDGNTLYQVWLEDSSSMEERLKEMQENELAGAAFWKLGFETKDIWDTIIKYM